MYLFFYFLIGLVAAWPLLAYVHRKDLPLMTHLLGISLLIAAVIYMGFAAVNGNANWMLIELAGVAAYGVFYLLAVRVSPLFLAAGWLLHPLWDVLLHLQGPGVHIVVEWYAVACLAFDVVTAAYIFYRVKLQRPTTASVPVA